MLSVEKRHPLCLHLTYVFGLLFFGVLKRISKPAATSKLNEKVALRAGSSKHGKASLAFVASNWVAAIILKVKITINTSTIS